MWWKVVIAVVCGVLLISPLDLSPGLLGVDDIGAVVGMIATIIGMISQQKKAFEDKKAANSAAAAGDSFNEVDDN